MTSTSGTAAFDRGAADLLAVELLHLPCGRPGRSTRPVVILVLRPALERMIVALVAVEAHGQEQVRRVLHQRRRVAEDLVIGGGRIFEVRAAGGQDLVGKLVVGLIRGDRAP